MTKGSAILEVDELFKENDLAVLLGDTHTRIDQKGLYSFNAEQSLIGVLNGKATVREGDQKVTLKKGHELLADVQPLKAQKLDEKAVEASSLYRWSKLRGEYEAQANVNAAQNVVVYGGWYGPGWYWAPVWNCYSFLPGAGMLYSPFGWGFYSPLWIGRIWAVPYHYHLGHFGYVPRIGRGAPVVRAARPDLAPRGFGVHGFAMHWSHVGRRG